MIINIWQARKKANLTLVELSDLTGISKSSLGNYENGKSSPTLHHIEKIAIALNVRITDLFESNYK